VRFALLVLLQVALLTSLSALAAEIERYGGHYGGLTVITLTGPIVDDDVGEFREAIAGVDRALVILNSPGGSAWPGLDIGRMVHTRGLDTAVAPGARCSSACAAIWIAGRRRLLHVEGTVGFHGAHRGRAAANGANALAGIYYRDLGLSHEFIRDASDMGPSELLLITPRVAMKYGLGVEFVTDDSIVTALLRARPRTQPAARRPSAAELARDAERFISRFMMHYEHPGGLPEVLIDRHYAPRVDYYGETLNRDGLKRRRRERALLWPIQRTVMTGDPHASCSDGICRVTGRAIFSARSDTRGVRGEDAIRYTFLLKHQGDSFVIVGERGEALGRQVFPTSRAEGRLVRQVQGELWRLGCNPGPVDGVWGPRSAAALGRFHRAWNTQGSEGRPTERDLVALKAARAPVCGP